MGSSFSVLAALAAVAGLSAGSARATEVTSQSVTAAVAKVSALARKETAQKVVPGIAIAVVFQDRLVFAQGFGVRDIASGAPVGADTVFQLASVSKPIASTVVAALVGEGRLAWTTPISDLDPTFQMPDAWVTRQVTVEDLFSHRSGLPGHAGDLLEDLGATRAQVLRQLRFARGGGAFRASYAYTNFGLTEAATAAARAAGSDWEDVSQSRLYGPLGMTATSSRYADFMARSDRAAGHVKVGGAWAARYRRDPDAQSPAGGVSSSVNDLARWMRLQLAGGRFEGRQVVDAKALEETHQPTIRSGTSPLTDAPQFYGLGWNVSFDGHGRLRLSHSGAFAQGASTTVYLVPAESLGIVVLVNAAPVGVSEGLAFTFIDEALDGRQTQDWLPLFASIFADPANLGLAPGADHSKPPRPGTPAAASPAYEGVFANAMYGKARVSSSGDGLTITLGPKGIAFPLRHFDRDIFTYETVGENAMGASGVTFTLGADGKASQVTVENLDEHGAGVFVRTDTK